MAFKDLLVALRNDEFRKLRRKESFQATDPTQLFDLVRDPCFETAI